jgi:hypothetical protein
MSTRHSEPETVWDWWIWSGPTAAELVVVRARARIHVRHFLHAAELVVVRARVRVRHLHGGGGGARDGYTPKHTHLLGRHLVLEWPEFCRIT